MSRRNFLLETQTPLAWTKYYLCKLNWPQHHLDRIRGSNQLTSPLVLLLEIEMGCCYIWIRSLKISKVMEGNMVFEDVYNIGMYNHGPIQINLVVEPGNRNRSTFWLSWFNNYGLITSTRKTPIQNTCFDNLTKYFSTVKTSVSVHGQNSH